MGSHGTNESMSNATLPTPPLQDRTTPPVGNQSMSTMAASLLAAHLLPEPGINLLHARLVGAKWLEAGNDAWLRTRGIRWVNHLQNQKYEQSTKQHIDSMSQLVDAHDQLIQKRRPSYVQAKSGFRFRLEQCLQASPLLHLVSLVLGATRADGYLSADIPIECLLAPSLLSSLLVLAIYSCTRGCYPIAREICLFRSHKSAMSHLHQLRKQGAHPVVVTTPSDAIDLEQGRDSLLNDCAPMPASIPIPYRVWWKSTESRPNRFLQMPTESRPNRESAQLSSASCASWHENNPVYKGTITEVVFFGTIASVAPALFATFLWLKMSKDLVSWYVVFSPWVLFCCAAIWCVRDSHSRSKRSDLYIVSSICAPILMTLGLSAARMESAIGWAYWQCFIPIDLLVVALVCAAIVVGFRPQGQGKLVQLLFVLLMVALLAVAAAIATFPFILDGFISIPFTSIAAVFSLLPFMALFFWVFLYV